MKLKSFPSVPILDREVIRFSELMDRFNKLLAHALSESGTFAYPVLIKLMCLGPDEFNAKPWIVVICDKTVRQKARWFFKQDLVRDQCRNPYSVGQDLKVIVFVRRGNLRPNGGATQIPIGLTFGGLVKVRSATGERLYGLTCGHAIDALTSNERRSSAISASHTDTDSSDGGVLESEEEYELELDDDDIININNTNGYPIDPHSRTFSYNQSGRIVVTSYDANACQPNLDWALIEPIEHPQYAANLPLSLTIPDFDSIMGLKSNTVIDRLSYIEKRVKVCTGSSGDLPATLQFRPSFFLGHGFKELIRVFAMRVKGKDPMGVNFNWLNNKLTSRDIAGLLPGDCGAWVVDEDNQQVYGHMIASNSFGEAYVVPMADTLQCIQKQLKAYEVTIPTAAMVNSMVCNPRAATVESTSNITEPTQDP